MRNNDSGREGSAPAPDRWASDYLRSLTVTQGARAGQSFEVLPWQAWFLRGALRPGVVEAVLEGRFSPDPVPFGGR